MLKQTHAWKILLCVVEIIRSQRYPEFVSQCAIERALPAPIIDFGKMLCCLAQSLGNILAPLMIEEMWNPKARLEACSARPPRQRRCAATTVYVVVETGVHRRALVAYRFHHGRTALGRLPLRHPRRCGQRNRARRDSAAAAAADRGDRGSSGLGHRVRGRSG